MLVSAIEAFTLLVALLSPAGVGRAYFEQMIVRPPYMPPAHVIAASCSQAHVQAAVDAAANGQIVQVPGGTCEWSGAWPDYYVQWTNKNVTLRGAGVGITVISCGTANGGPGGGFCIRNVTSVADNTYSQSDLSHFTFRITAPSGIAVQWLDNAALTTPHWGSRIHHNRFWYDATGSGNTLGIQGPNYPLIDHNTFDWKNQGIVVGVTSGAAHENTETNPAGEVMWRQPADLGSENFLFIEDNDFNNLSVTTQGIVVMDTAGGGGRVVIRHNTVDAGFFNHHWVRGLDWCGTVIEVYNNVFAGNENQFANSPGALESGTGVFFENQVTGYKAGFGLTERRGGGTESSGYFGACAGSKDHDGNAGDVSAPGWPCLGQVGRAPGKTFAQLVGGEKQASLPLYLWKNGVEPTCATGGACTNSIGVSVNPGAAYIKATAHTVTGGGFGEGEVDYLLGGDVPKAGYTPYTYPHPRARTP